MVRVYGPAMSLDASGTLANTLVFSKWKGRNYVRERVIPSNPKSGAQTGRRAMMKFLAQGWAALAGVDQATWDDLADNLVASPFNAYVSANMKGWHNFLAPSEGTPPTRTGTPSDNALTAAVWEENRIKLSLAGAALGDNWGIVIFAKVAGAVTPAVGNGILVEPDLTIAAHDVYWTPPEVGTWHFNSIAFSDDGAQAAAGGAQDAVPP